MTESGGIGTGRHGVFALHTHSVFATKYRHPVFSDVHLQRMEETKREVCGDLETEPAESNGEGEHVHPSANLPPKTAPSPPGSAGAPPSRCPSATPRTILRGCAA